MSVFHDEIEIEDFEYDKEEETYYYPCPCGDRFQITRVSRTSVIIQRLTLTFSVLQEELLAGEEVATCPSCSLVVKVIYDLVSLRRNATCIQGHQSLIIVGGAARRRSRRGSQSDR